MWYCSYNLKPENVLVWIPNIEEYLKIDTAPILEEIKQREAQVVVSSPTTPNTPNGRRSSTASWKDGVDMDTMTKSKKKRLKKKMKKKNLEEASKDIINEEPEDIEDKMGNLKISTNWTTPNETKVIASTMLDIATIDSDAGDQVFDNIIVKIADLGNACWTDGEYTHVIQTRQYRSPEVIVGAKWTTEADMWSMACLIFELLTGEFLFDPRAGSKYNKDDDHLAQILELMRTVPKLLITGGEFSREFFDRTGKLKHIKKLRYRRLRDVLHDTFLVPPEDADAASVFLLPMLEMDMTKRAPASQMLKSPWLQNA
ncbi:unnamed protein product [Mucor hiemalis]